MLNDLGRDAARAVGHKALWTKNGRLVDFLKESKYAAAYQQHVAERGKTRSGRSIEDPTEAHIFVEEFGTTSQPVDWYYVEVIEGEYDDDPDADPTVNEKISGRSQDRVESNQPCPQSGWWMTPAKSGSRRYFKAGEIMPSFGSDYGLTIWQWDVDQTPPTI